MSDIKSFKIGGNTYKLVVMAPWHGAAYAARVAGLVSKSLAGEAEEAKNLAELKEGISSGGISDKLITRIVSMVARILPHIDPDQFSELAKTAFNKSQVTAPNGSSLSEEGLFDEWFNDHRADFFPVAIWAIKENCAGFFVGGGAGWSALAAQLTPSKSPTIE